MVFDVKVTIKEGSASEDMLRTSFETETETVSLNLEFQTTPYCIFRYHNTFEIKPIKHSVVGVY